jgi:hypothetical protein
MVINAAMLVPVSNVGVVVVCPTWSVLSRLVERKRVEVTAMMRKRSAPTIRTLSRLIGTSREDELSKELSGCGGTLWVLSSPGCTERFLIVSLTLCLSDDP